MTKHIAMPGNMEMDHHSAMGPMQQPMSHHMVVFGHGRVFMSHLAMFSVPEHSYQMIIEAELAAAHGDPTQIYRQDRAEHPESAFYTFAPKPFVLPDLLPADGQPPRKTTFSGELWRNHLEQPATDPVRIASAVTVTVRNIVCGRRFDPAAAAPPQLQYLLFGGGDEVFLAHLITRPPDFDQLLPAAVTPAFSDEDLSRGHILTVDDHPNTESHRLLPTGPSVTADVDTGATRVRVQVTAGSEFYFNDDSDMQA